MGHYINLIFANFFKKTDYQILISFGMMFSIVCSVEADEIAFKNRSKRSLTRKTLNINTV